MFRIGIDPRLDLGRPLETDRDPHWQYGQYPVEETGHRQKSTCLTLFPLILIPDCKKNFYFGVFLSKVYLNNK